MTAPKLVPFQPHNNYLLIRRDKAEEKTPTGIVTPSAHQHEKNSGVLLAKGPTAFKNYSDLTGTPQAGQRVLFAGYGGNETKIGDENLLLIPDTEILGVFTDEPSPPAAAAGRSR